jgi:protein-disulfide isomerase-like protein with CxxC motif
MELAEMYADFERWGLVGTASSLVHPDDRYWTIDDGTWYVNKPVAAALIESAVLDELERREMVWMHCLVQGEPTLIMHNYDRPQWVGTGPTRLARLHAACKQAFGGG